LVKDVLKSVGKQVIRVIYVICVIRVKRVIVVKPVGFNEPV